MKNNHAKRRIEKYGTNRDREISYLMNDLHLSVSLMDCVPWKRIDLLHSPEYVIYLLTVSGEARGESTEGIRAVCSVINNRYMHQLRYFGKTPREVCLKNQNGVYQFSCWNPTDPNYQWMLDPIPSEVAKVARIALDFYFSKRDVFEDRRTCYYKVKDTHSLWFETQLVQTCTIGNHEFWYDPTLPPIKAKGATRPSA